MDDRKFKIRQFLSRFFTAQQIDDGDDIFSLGVINSLLALQLVAFLEKEFGIMVEDEDLDIDNFRSLNAMDRLVETKLMARAAV